jgi:class 3 adenylate cyclase
MTNPTQKAPHGLPSCEDLDALLDQRIEHPEQQAILDQQITDTFEQERTIFVLDMSGFSRTVQRYGIIHYLAMIRRMRRIVRPAIERNKGFVIKFEADNCFAVFDTPDQAIEAARDIHHDLNVANLMTADESDVHVSIGIGHGPVLLTCEDMYGNELNLASKLGEDVAERNEVLLTDAARTRVTGAQETFQVVPLTISGVNMNAYRLKI